MDFFSDGTASGFRVGSRAEIHSQINDLYDRIDEEKERKEELLYEIARIDRALERFSELICDMEAMLK